jgi:cell division septum initiation protein DivIVA
MSLSRKRQQDQEAALAELEKQVYGPKETPAEPETPPAEPAAEPASEPAPAPADAVEPAPAPAPAVSEATWEHKFKVLEGKYKAEVPELHKQLKVVPDLHKQLKALADKVKTLEAKPQEPAPKLLKPEEVDQYGEEFLDMVARAAEQKFAPERQQLLGKIEALEAAVGKIGDAQAHDAQVAFVTELTSLAPDWEAVDGEDGWKAWLAEYDHDARRLRQDILDDALASRDAKYVASMISKWKATQARAPSLATLAAPAASKGTPPAAPAKKIWSKADVEAFYREASKPRGSKYSPEEAARIEQDIDSAVREGRYKG